MLFCCLWCNVHTSCHKHFVIVSRHQQTPPLTTSGNCHNLPRSGGAVLIIPSRSQRRQHAMKRGDWKRANGKHGTVKNARVKPWNTNYSVENRETGKRSTSVLGVENARLNSMERRTRKKSRLYHSLEWYTRDSIHECNECIPRETIMA